MVVARGRGIGRTTLLALIAGVTVLVGGAFGAGALADAANERDVARRDAVLDDCRWFLEGEMQIAVRQGVGEWSVDSFGQRATQWYGGAAVQDLVDATDAWWRDAPGTAGEAADEVARAHHAACVAVARTFEGDLPEERAVPWE